MYIIFVVAGIIFKANSVSVPLGSIVKEIIIAKNCIHCVSLKSVAHC